MLTANFFIATLAVLSSSVAGHAVARASSTASVEEPQQTYTGGMATFFTQNDVAGACGTVHSDSDLIVAIGQPAIAAATRGILADTRVASALYGPYNQKSDLCGKQVKIINDNTGKSVIATIVSAALSPSYRHSNTALQADACPTCPDPNWIDCSIGTFEATGATQDEGMFPRTSCPLLPAPPVR
jgi:hypothetical protein